MIFLACTSALLLGALSNSTPSPTSSHLAPTRGVHITPIEVATPIGATLAQAGPMTPFELTPSALVALAAFEGSSPSEISTSIDAGQAFSPATAAATSDCVISSQQITYEPSGETRELFTYSQTVVDTCDDGTVIEQEHSYFDVYEYYDKTLVVTEYSPSGGSFCFANSSSLGKEAILIGEKKVITGPTCGSSEGHCCELKSVTPAALIQTGNSELESEFFPGSPYTCPDGDPGIHTINRLTYRLEYITGLHEDWEATGPDCLPSEVCQDKQTLNTGLKVWVTSTITYIHEYKCD